MFFCDIKVEWKFALVKLILKYWGFPNSSKWGKEGCIKHCDVEGLRGIFLA